MPQLLLALLVVINCARLFRHAMLRDELQSFMLAAASSRPLDLFAKLKYEGHPGLWHAGSTVNSVIRKARPLIHSLPNAWRYGGMVAALVSMELPKVS